MKTKTIKNMVRVFAVILVVCVLCGLVVAQVSSPPTPPGPGPSPTEYKFKLYKGWNMISSPVGVIDVSEIMGCNIKVVYYLDEETYYDGYYSGKHHYKVKPRYLKTTTLKPMIGYWALVENDCEAIVYGNDVANTLLTFSSDMVIDVDMNGWYMISSSKSWDEIKGDCDLVSPIYTWDPITKQYNVIPTNQKLEDHKGYFVYLDLSKKKIKMGDRNLRACLISEGDIIGKSGYSNFCKATYKIGKVEVPRTRINITVTYNNKDLPKDTEIPIIAMPAGHMGCNTASGSSFSNAAFCNDLSGKCIFECGSAIGLDKELSFKKYVDNGGELRLMFESSTSGGYPHLNNFEFSCPYSAA